jgi:hypothetical protein
MTQSEKERLVEIVGGLAELYGKTLSKPAIWLYVNALSDLHFRGVSDALSKLAKESRFFPMPAEVRGLCEPTSPAIESVAEQQAAIVLNAIRQHGAKYEPAWEDPTTRSLFRGRFRWTSLCSTLTEEETMWFVREFKQAYLAAADAGAALGPLEFSCDPNPVVATLANKLTAWPDKDRALIMRRPK